MAADGLASAGGARRRTLRVAQVPAQRAGATSYLTLLTGALRGAGVEVIAPERSELWRIGWDRGVDVVHLHWLEFIAPSAPGGLAGLARTLIRHVRLVLLLAWLRIRGVALVWTVHNLRPHEPMRPGLEAILPLLVSRICHAVVAHSDYARERIGELWGRSVKVMVIPHGNYLGVFPPAETARDELRERLGIPADAFVFLAFGQVRPYKRLPDLLTAFRALPGKDARLLIAGKSVVAEEARRLQEAAHADSRVLLDLREIPDAEVAGLHLCADVAVLAYRDVFSSGALLLALSFGLPVVAAGSSTADEIAGGIAAETFAPGGLSEAMRAVQQNRSARSAAALDAARRYPWSRVGVETAALYRALRPRAAASTS